MKINIHSYFIKFFFEWEMFETNVVEQKTKCMFSKFFFSPKFMLFMRQYSKTLHSQTGHTPCWIPKTTNTRLEYVMLIAFPLQQWLHKSASMLCYMYFACLVFVVCCVGNSLCDELITHWEESYHMCVCVCVCVCSRKRWPMFLQQYSWNRMHHIPTWHSDFMLL